MLTALDQIANRNHLQLWKAAIPYLPKDYQRSLSLYIKLMELQNITSYFSVPSTSLRACSTEDHQNLPLTDILKEMSNFCDENEKKMIDQIFHLMTTLELFSIMMEKEENEERGETYE